MTQARPDQYSRWVAGPGVSQGPSLAGQTHHSHGRWTAATLCCLLWQKCHQKERSGALHTRRPARPCPAVPQRVFTTSPLSQRGDPPHFPGGQSCSTGRAPLRGREAPFALISQRPTPPLAIVQQSDCLRIVPSQRQWPVTGHQWPHTPSPGCQQLSVCLRNCWASRAKG